MTVLRHSLIAVILLLAAGGAHAEPLKPAKFNYMMQCQGCHKADGEGAPDSVPDLRTWGGALLAIPEGRRFFVSVPGSANAPLTDAELADVLNYIISDILKDSEIEHFSMDEVTRYRSRKIKDVTRVRAELIAFVSMESVVTE